MNTIYFISNNDKYRYALGEVQDYPNRVLFCFGINPSKATPQKLDPTAKRIKRIAIEHGYDSWIILNVCAQRATDPNEMHDDSENDLISNSQNLKIITDLLEQYSFCSDILFAYGDLINKRPYLNKDLCDIIDIIKLKNYPGNCFCLGKTKLGNPRHPLYQKIDTAFVPFSPDYLLTTKVRKEPIWK